MLFQYSDLVMAKYIVKLLPLVELMLYLNVLPLFLKLPVLCFIPDVITMFAEFGSVPMFYVSERCGVVSVSRYNRGQKLLGKLRPSLHFALLAVLFGK